MFKDYKKPTATLWEEVRRGLYEYVLDVGSNPELEFYSGLAELKVRVLLCGAMFQVNPELLQFLARVGQRIEM